MTPSPALAWPVLFHELIRDLSLFVADIHKPPFERAKLLKEFKARVDELKSYDIVTGYTAAGSVACAMGDIAEMDRLHKISIQHQKNYLTCGNYAGSLYIVGRLDEAFSYAMMAIDDDPLSYFTLDLLTRICYEAGMNEEFETWANRYQQITGKPHDLAGRSGEDKSLMLSAVCTKASEDALARIWNSPEEDAAWANL